MTFTILPRHVWKPPKISQSHLPRGFFTQSRIVQVSWCHYLINIPPRKLPFCWGRECAWLLLFQLKSRKKKRLWFALPQNMLSAFVAERRWCVSGGRTGKCLAWREICGLEPVDGMIWRGGSGGRELQLHDGSQVCQPRKRQEVEVTEPTLPCKPHKTHKQRRREGERGNMAALTPSSEAKASNEFI